MTKQRLASIISIVFDPLVEGPILLIIFFLAKSTAPFWLLVLIVFIDTFFPILFMFYGLKRGFISDWETTNRHERHSLNFVLLLITFLNLFLFYIFSDSFLLRAFFVFLILILIYALITFFWKISGHMTANTAFVITLNILSGWQLWWLVFLLPLVAWARLVRNKHDVWQILGGVALASLIVLCGASFLF
ncbi:hypothetical protein ISS86_03360 [Candidatus Microgenomates bacterium]|nr:hypothetical protein [Candidatus Microgenomates bacterium]